MAFRAKVHRARRSFLKAVGLVAAAAAAGHATPAAAQNSGPCFLRGTLIRTAAGYRAVETLAAGDTVPARFGGNVTIKAVHSFTTVRDGARRAWIGDTRPVTLRRGALGAHAPEHDLCLTASHAVLVGGMLVPVGQLVNGASIVLEEAAGRDTLEFFHVELERHDVLDAQGVPCESLRQPEVAACAPVAGFNGAREELRSRLRSLCSVVVDCRRPLDIIRDDLEERGLRLRRAA